MHVYCMSGSVFLLCGGVYPKRLFSVYSKDLWFPQLYTRHQNLGEPKCSPPENPPPHTPCTCGP